MKATERRKAAQAVFGGFVANRCGGFPIAMTRATNAYMAYATWVRDCGAEPWELMSETLFYLNMGARFPKKRDNSGTFYVGLMVRDSATGPFKCDKRALVMDDTVPPPTGARWIPE